MSTTYLTGGVVLKRRPYRETDRIVTLFTDRYGKIDAIARGVKKGTSKLASHLEPMSYASFMLATGRTFDVLATSVKRSSFRLPLSDLGAFALAHYFFEAVDELTRPRQADEALFRLLVQYLETMENGAPGHTATLHERWLVTDFFLWQLLVRTGFAPSLDRCVIGRERLGIGAQFVSTRHGGVVCGAHREAEDGGRELSAHAIEMLRVMADGHLQPLLLVNPEGSALAEVDRAIADFLRYHSSAPLAARDFLLHLFPHST